MTIEKINDATREAIRFLESVKKYSAKYKKEKWVITSKESGAIRRSSMDLTRALAEMRK